MAQSELVILLVGDFGEAANTEPYLSSENDIIVKQIERFEYKALVSALSELPSTQKVLVLSKPDEVKFSDSFHERILAHPISDEVLFGASLLMEFADSVLHYFYWKHYPRPHSHYNFLDATAFLGTAGRLSVLLSEVEERYAYSSDYCTLSDMLSRYYADGLNRIFKPSVAISLDHDQELIASTHLSNKSKSIRGWLYQTLYHLNEQRLAGKDFKHTLNIKEKNGDFFHLLTKSAPATVIVADSRAHQISKDENPVGSVRLETLKQIAYITKVNRGVLSKERIFRNTPNKSTEIDHATRRIIERLEKREPVSFAHYNDGELTFIRDFLSGNHHDKWFGRKQQQYDPLLAERLYEAIKFQKEGYFVGVPCSIDHPDLRKEADEIVGNYENKVQAMSIHHNLYYVPRLIEALKGRDVFFFVNEYQDLSLFEKLGVVVSEQRIVKVPFRNSYLEYDKYEDMDFPKDSVVILMCGMLAKILTKAWFDNQNSISTLALGASLDDHIQVENIGFELFPKKYPLTRNIKKYRSFLFGPKKRCKECFDF
ncbi:MAG: hypothetical protein JXR10_08080 [Cyclobacteriaceae bacterium]